MCLAAYLVAAELPVVRIAHGAFNEKVAAVWVAAEQGFYRKQGVNVEVINIRSGPQTMAAMASGDIQIAYTIPGSVLSAFAAGMDVAFFGGIVNRADGDFVVAPNIARAEELKGKKLGVQSIGGGVWSLAMLALEHLGLEPNRDKILVMVLGDQPVLTQAMATGKIDAAYLGYTFSTLLKEKGFRVLLDIGKAPIPYQGLALAARRSYLQQNGQIVDAVLRGTLEGVAFIQKPGNHEAVVKSLARHLRLSSAKEAESGYEVLQWLYSMDIRPNCERHPKHAAVARGDESERVESQGRRRGRRRTGAAPGKEQLLQRNRGAGETLRDCRVCHGLRARKAVAVENS